MMGLPSAGIVSGVSFFLGWVFCYASLTSGAIFFGVSFF